MNIFVNAPFEWCQKCSMFSLDIISIHGLRADGLKTTHEYRCKNIDICIAANKAREEMEKESRI